MVCTGFIQPLDLQCIFVNTLAGSNDIFLGIAFLAIAILAGKFRMMTTGVAIMYGLFIILVSTFFSGWLLLVALILGLGIGWTVSRLLKSFY